MGPGLDNLNTVLTAAELSTVSVVEVGGDPPLLGCSYLRRCYGEQRDLYFPALSKPVLLGESVVLGAPMGNDGTGRAADGSTSTSAT